MARRRGAEVEVEEEPEGTVRLAFNEPLSWRAGKAIPNGELHKRLNRLYNELTEMDQEMIDKSSFTKVAKELAGQNLLGHKDKGVRAFVSTCIVEVIRLCAPEAPFSGSQLKDIFTCFVTSILPSLSDPSNTYNTQHKCVLESLTEVKSICLLDLVPNSDHLVLHIFINFFDIMSGSAKFSTDEPVSKDVGYLMTEMLVTIVDEFSTLPTEAVESIMAQFLRVASLGGKGKGDVRADDRQLTLTLKEFPEGYNMAKAICARCPEKMARCISQYFNDVILDMSPGAPSANGPKKATNADNSDDEELPVGPTEADLKELFKAHNLLRELWRACPSVLQNVIPQLEAELSAENVQLRLLATETLGDIISGIGAAGPPSAPILDSGAYPLAKLGDLKPLGSASESVVIKPASPQSFSQAYPSVYTNFLGRKNDKSSVIRSGWTTAVGRILVTSAGGIGLRRDEEAILVKGLAEKLNDADEKVRFAAVKAVGTFSFQEIMTKLAPNGGVSKSGSVLGSLADRARDRKHQVRVEGMTTLARIWGVAAGEILAGNEAVTAALGAIPSKVVDAFYANDLELNVLLDHVMFEELIPLRYPPPKSKKVANGDSQGQSQVNGGESFNPDKIRTERILLVIKSLDAKSKKAFFAMQGRQPTFSKVLDAFIKRCQEFNGGVATGKGNPKEIRAKLDAVIKWLSDLLPDSLRTTQDLSIYANLHDRRSYKFLENATAVDSDFKTVNRSITEFAKRIEATPGAPAGLLQTMMPIIYRSSSLVYNRSHLPYIMQYSRSDENGLGSTAHEVMHEISEKHPHIFKDNVKELCKSLVEQAPSSSKPNDLSSVETLKDLASFAKDPNSSKEIPRDRNFISTLMSFAQYGTPPKAAKYAVSILMATSEKKEMHGKDLLEKSIQGWEFGGDHFLTKLAAISQLTLLVPLLTDDASGEIIAITTKQLLLQSRTEIGDDDPSWKSDAEIDQECQAKCWALKILVNRLRAVHDDKEAAGTVYVPVYKILNLLIDKQGEMLKTNNTPEFHKSRLRLLAAQSMLKLCTSKTYNDLLLPVDFNRLALVAQDPLSNVRQGIVEKIQKYLVNHKLVNRFYTIIFLTAFEPDQSFRNSIITWIRSRAKVFHDQKSRSLESVFARLISLLAYHPDFSLDPSELIDHARYLLFYITSVVTEENIPLVYKYAERVKQASDGISKTDPEKIYVISDLATALLKKWQEKKGWIMQTWPAKVGLPIGIFATLPSHEVAQGIAEKQYLPAPTEMDDRLDALVRNADKKKKRKSDDRDSNSHPSKKQKSESKPRVSKTPATKKEKPIKVKKTPAKPKKSREDDEFDTPAMSSANRRKSGRSASARKSYADRDSSEDDEEMWDGVAEWKFVSDGEQGRTRKRKLSSESPSEIDATPSVLGDEPEQEEGKDIYAKFEEAGPGEKKQASEAELELSQVEPEPEIEPEADSKLSEHDQESEEEENIEERDPTPPRSNGRKATAKSKAKKSIVKVSPKAAAKPKPKLRTNPRAKGPLDKLAPVRGTRALARTRSRDVVEHEDSD